MDNFIGIINSVNDKYNDIYVTYFLYRLWIKNRKLIIYTNGREEYNKILTLLGIPEEYLQLDIVFPLNNYMFYKSKKEIDTAIISSLFKMNMELNKVTNSLNNDIEIKKLYDNFKLFIQENSNQELIENKLSQFRKKLNLQYKNIYISNLNN